MRETNGRSRRLSMKVKAAAAALVTIFAVAALGASGAQASTVGGPVSADFNYVGINVTALGNELNEIVLTPETENPATPEDDFLPPLQMDGTYTNNTGAFTLPQSTGLTFPKLAVSIGPAAIEAEIGLAAPATGTYNDVTGAMTLNAKISLTLGTDHLEDIDGLPISGTGPLKCQVSPLDVSLSTNPTNWPAPGAVFADPATIENGAIAGSWNTKPKVIAIVENSGLCPIIGGLLEPVGGLYLANSDMPITDMPTATTTKPAPRPCDPGTTGTPGTPQAECKLVPLPECAENETGTPPNCVPIEEPATPYKVSKTVITPSSGTIKAGGKMTLKIKVTNSGETAGSSNVAIKSSNGKVTVPKTVKISVPAGGTASKSITVKASKKAKGKATITAKAGSKTGTAKLTVKAAKKKKK